MLTAVINCLTSLLAGFVVFAVLGYMAHIRHSTVEELALQGKSSPEDIELLSCSTQLSMKFSLQISMKMPRRVGISYLLAEKFSCSTMFSKKNLQL